ncbi:MAG: GTP-binding protein [Myxococcota bacterium]
MQKQLRRIPVNVICGSLGVGKTTAINHLLAQRPKGERWAVLVNEYGQIGLDQALLTASDKPGVDVREVAGGCICCSAGFMFQVSLILLLRTRPDRLLIEPTGLATLSGILDTLLHPGIREAVDLRSVVTLVAPGSWPEDGPRPEILETMTGADVLLANRADEATEEQLHDFDLRAQAFFPKKKLFGRMTQGQIPIEVLDLVSSRKQGPLDALVAESDPAEHGHHKHAAHEHVDPAPSVGPDTPMVRRAHISSIASTMGWVVRDDHVFDHDGMKDLFRGWMGRGAQRLKAVVQTDHGWWSYNLTENSEQIERSPYRRDSRLELVFQGEGPDVSGLEEALRARLVEAP